MTPNPAGDTSEEVLRAAGRQDEMAALIAKCLDSQAAHKAADFPTSIRRPSQPEFDLLLQHGYEFADYTLFAQPDGYQFIGNRDSFCGTHPNSLLAATS